MITIAVLVVSSQKMFADLCDYLGEEIVVLHIEGCASIVDFRDVIGKTVKVVMYDGVDDESVETVVRMVKAEALALPHSCDYDLSKCTFEKTVTNTCPTLLVLVVSRLVSNGELNKSAVTISQCIQQHISNPQIIPLLVLLGSGIVNLVVQHS